ncbi:PGPGW domain-containing protein [Pseudonocardia nigra]|uniref:PGPGW domain-containing protein n=1 Tax=Pseudonocardia nigra TaxID=1921578 RepID=UPI001C5CC8EE|nr:PGPGW domain-containing protein [Pseudonocardia nigra]
MTDRRPTAQRNPFARAGVLAAGSVLVLVGIALLVLPGPGLLLVLSGLVVLSHGFPAVGKYVEPVRERALQAAEESVSSPLRIAGSVLAGLVLIGAGVVWGLVPTLPLGGWSTGSSLVLSGVAVLGLLVYSYRRVHR